MFKKYTTEQYLDLNITHNILCLVGNGFDIALLNYLNPILRRPSKTTSFRDFYDFLKDEIKLTDNLIYEKMSDDRSKNIENWADFEFSVQEMIQNPQINNDDLLNSLYAIRSGFVLYLYQLIDPDLLIMLSNLSMKNKWASNSMSKFLKDINNIVDYNRLQFKNVTSHYDLFNFLFVNFNYTALFDNYIFLDTAQFDPHIYKGVDRNFDFYNESIPKNPSNETIWSSYLMADVIHPHGTQNIPRSIIFGADIPSCKPNSKEKFLNKPFVAQNDNKYFDFFDNTELFIIYGMSLGLTDSWWLDSIFEQLMKEDKQSELIIYWHSNQNTNCDFVINKFFNSCVRHRDKLSDKKIISTVKNKIFIVQFNDNNTHYLGFNDKTE